MKTRERNCRLATNIASHGIKKYFFSFIRYFSYIHSVRINSSLNRNPGVYTQWFPFRRKNNHTCNTAYRGIRSSFKFDYLSPEFKKWTSLTASEPRRPGRIFLRHILLDFSRFPKFCDLTYFDTFEKYSAKNVIKFFNIST